MTIKYSHLSLDERIKIEVCLNLGATKASLAGWLGRHRSTIGREVKRATHPGLSRYLADFAQRHYLHLRRLAGRQRRKLGSDLSSALWQHLIPQLRHGLSPEQISGRMRFLDGLHLPAHQHSALYVSHQTLYRAIHDLPHSPQRSDLTRLLRRSTGGRRRRKPCARYTGLRRVHVTFAKPTEMPIPAPLQELQCWYRSQCNQNWEHSNGVRIDTLDNPGWSLTIDLAGTDLQNKLFAELKWGVGADSEPESEDWIVCKVDGQTFLAHGGPYKLEEMINTVLTSGQEHRIS